MKVLVEEYFDILLTIIGGLIIIAIAVSSVLSINIVINHSEEINRFDLITEKIDSFECKDVLMSSDEYELLKNQTVLVSDYINIFKDVTAFSNTNTNIIDNVYAHISDTTINKSVVFVLKYCNDFRIMKTKLYIKGSDNNENNV